MGISSIRRPGDRRITGGGVAPWVLLTAILAGGCAAPSPAPISAGHPAHPGAPEAAVPARSDTLAIGTPERESEPASQPGHHEPAKGHAEPAPHPAAHYTCPMHPEVDAPTPGRCPKCGMALVEKKGTEGGR